MVCTKCFAEIPDTSAFCMECGARLREDTTDPLYAEGSDREVYPEIARANLLRMKGQYEQAIEVCLGILKRYPSNETAHALMGDIYADQGKLADAIQWYELLVDLAPTNPTYRAKLDQLRSIQAIQQVPPSVASTTPAVSAPSTRAWVYLLGGLLVLILVVSAFVAGRRMTLAATEPTTVASSRPPGLTGSTEQPSTPVIPPPAENRSADGLAGTVPPGASSGTALPFSGMSEIEERLAHAISQRLNGLPVWCLFDPLTNRWTVRTRIQAGALTRTRVMQEALVVAEVAFEQAPSLQSITIAILVPGTGGSDTLLFSAEIGRAMLTADVHTLTDAQIEAIFRAISVWWNPAVPLPTSPATGTAPAPSNPASR